MGVFGVDVRKMRKGEGEWILRNGGGGIKIYTGHAPWLGGVIVTFADR